MSSDGDNFDLGLQRKSPYPWLQGQVGGSMSGALDAPPRTDEHADSVGAPPAPRPQATPQTQPTDPEPTAPHTSATAKFWQGLLGTLGHRSTIAAILGSLATAKSGQQQDEYGQARQSWLDRQKMKSDQARIDLEGASARAADARANKPPDPLWKVQGYTVPGSRPQPGAEGPVKPDYSGALSFNEHGSTPPQFPEGAIPHAPVRDDMNVSPFEAWQKQNPGRPVSEYQDMLASTTEKHRRPLRDPTPHWTARDIEVPDPNNPGKTIRKTSWYNASSDQPPTEDAGAVKHEKVTPRRETGAEMMRRFIAGGDAPTRSVATPQASEAGAPQYRYKTRDGKMGYDAARKQWVPIR